MAKEIRTQKILEIFFDRFSKKAVNDAKIQIQGLYDSGKIEEDTYKVAIGELDKTFDNKKKSYSLKFNNEDEMKLLTLVFEKLDEVIDDMNEKLEEVYAHCYACDSYEQEMAIMVTYDIVNNNMRIEDFR